MRNREAKPRFSPSGFWNYYRKGRKRNGNLRGEPKAAPNPPHAHLQNKPRASLFDSLRCQKRSDCTSIARIHTKDCPRFRRRRGRPNFCLLYTSDAADDLLCVDLGGRRIIKQKTAYKGF